MIFHTKERTIKKREKKGGKRNDNVTNETDTRDDKE